MSGKTKRSLYYIADFLLMFAAFAGAILIIVFRSDGSYDAHLYVGVSALVCSVALRIPTLFHELGHLICGIFVGMKPISFSVGPITLSNRGVKFCFSYHIAGSTVLIPRGDGHMRGRALVSVLGGGICGMLLGGTLLALYFCLEYSYALAFFAIFSCFLLYESVRALLPAELVSGKTDGALAWGLIRKKPEEEVLLRVYEIQGILFRGSFSQVPEEKFIIPVVREDLPALHAILFMKMQKLLSEGKGDAARTLLGRLQELSEYQSDEERGEVERYARFFSGEFESIKKEPLHGVRELEKLMNKMTSEQSK